MLITIEGNDGVGKSTFAKRLQSWFSIQSDHPWDVQLSKEPGAVLDGAIRAAILNHKKVNPLTNLFLFMADRAEHIASTVGPKLAKGQIVLLDRFIHSTFVYQSLVGQILPLGELWQLNKLATGGLFPDLVILLDAPAEVCNERLKKRHAENPGTEIRLAEAEGLEYQSKVRDAFLWLAEQYPKQFLILDATADVNTNLALACEEIKKRFHEQKKAEKR